MYYALSHRAQNVWLLAASYTFYAFWDWRFLGLILASTLIDFIAAQAMQRARETGRHGRMRLALSASVGGNLLILGFFKYFNFFVDSAGGGPRRRLLTPGNHPRHRAPRRNLFYTFQTMSYTIDVFRGRVEPTRNLLDFALYVAFFPQLVAGPIERATSLLPQIQRRRVVGQRDWDEGVLLIFVGLFRKVVVADTAGSARGRILCRPGVVHVDSTGMRTGPLFAADLQRFRRLQQHGARLRAAPRLQTDPISVTRISR